MVSLIFGKKTWKSLFDHVMNPLMKHVACLLGGEVMYENDDNAPDLAPESEIKQDVQSIRGRMKDCKYLCLVGGLSCSKYFQHRIITEFREKSAFKLQVIVPDAPILSVVKGAAYFGLQTDYIKGRVHICFSVVLV